MSSDLWDKEIVDSFISESQGLLKELEVVVNGLEDTEVTDPFPEELLKEFAQKIDRIMGAAQTIAMFDPTHPGPKCIGQVTKICKHLGYKAAEKKDPAFIPLFAGLWAETLEILNEILKVLYDTEKCQEINATTALFLENRLQWLAKKLNPAAA